MKFLFHNDTAFNSIRKYALDTWTCLKRGEGEEEIANHGRSRVKSFSQETGATGQQSHGVTILSRSYTLKSQVQDAYDSQTQLPFFFFLLFFVFQIFLTQNASAEIMPMPTRFMKGAATKSPDQKLHDVSEMYEKHFLREMMKAMRSTVHESGFIQQNQAEKIFREQLDDQYVDKWSEKGGIGLSKLIYDQLIDKFGVQLGIKNAITKPQGPLPLDEKSNFTAHPFSHPGRKNSVSYRIDKMKAEKGSKHLQQSVFLQGNNRVKAPWDGVLVGKKTLVDNQTLLQIEHDNGLKSELAFKGDLSNISTGHKVQAGETLGLLSSDSKSLYWVIDSTETPRPQTVSE